MNNGHTFLVPSASMSGRSIPMPNALVAQTTRNSQTRSGPVRACGPPPTSRHGRPRPRYPRPAARRRPSRAGTRRRVDQRPAVADERWQQLLLLGLARNRTDRRMLARSMSPIATWIERKLRDGLVKCENQYLLDDEAAVAQKRPAGLLHGLAPIGTSPVDDAVTGIADCRSACRGGNPQNPTSSPVQRAPC